MSVRRGLTAAPSQTIWPVLVLVCVGVLAPTACVLWFMNQAVRNEQLAVRQRLADVYRSRLTEAAKSLDAYWQARFNALRVEPADGTEAQTFARLVIADVADSIVVSDAGGQVLYPREVRADDIEQEPPDSWRKAQELEFLLKRPAEAAAVYAAIAAQTREIELAARAMVSQARCLTQSGQIAAARGVLMGVTDEEKYARAKDAQGRLLQCHAQLLLLQLPGSAATPDFKKTADALIRRVLDYRDAGLSSAQRRFLMAELKSLIPDRPAFPTLMAEELAADYLDTVDSSAKDSFAPEPGRLSLSPRGDLWCLASADARIVALYRKPQADAAMQKLIERAVALPDVSVVLRSLSEPSFKGAAPAFISQSAGEFLPQHQLTLVLQGPDPLAAAARRRVLLYMWTAGAGIFVIVLLGLVLGRLITRQFALARLKNDLVATVTHELKTPLASMRVLVDTLSEGRCPNPEQAQEYYRLITKENERLSRLIENFLTFSRMERNKSAFEFVSLDPADLIARSICAMGDRLQPPNCRCDTHFDANLPTIMGDRDALVTVVLNLLDNACKYTEGDRQIAIRAYAENGSVCLEVRDNGIGMSKRTARKVFERFYQEDRSLSRKAGGCGLGLSIVKFIVSAHGGTVGVVSEPGRGSTFTVKLPAHRSLGAHV